MEIFSLMNIYIVMTEQQFGNVAALLCISERWSLRHKSSPSTMLLSKTEETSL